MSECPECEGAVLQPITDTLMRCPRCGYEKEDEVVANIRIVIPTKEQNDEARKKAKEIVGYLPTDLDVAIICLSFIINSIEKETGISFEKWDRAFREREVE